MIERTIEENCLEREEPYCTNVCPFGLNVREFIARLQRGNIRGAYRMLRDTVGFPDIVSKLCPHPCTGVCVRKDADAEVSLPLLEQAAVSLAGDMVMTDYGLPAKKERIAVIGAGPGGLACALRLAEKKYDVTVYERDGRIGGSLWKHLEPKLFLEELERLFRCAPYTLHLNTDLNCLPADKYDSICIATGKNGNDFGYLSKNAAEGQAGPPVYDPNIVLIGSLLGADPVGAIAHGLKAAVIIEHFIKTGKLQKVKEQNPSRIVIDNNILKKTDPVFPANSSVYTKEEARKEADRCIRCACDACVRHCDLMQYYKQTPHKLADTVAATVEPASFAGNERPATRMVASCDQCKMCGSVCPEGIDICEMFKKSRFSLREQGALPWAFHDFWLRDMAHANGVKASLHGVPYDSGRCGYLFFPGCQLGASDPRYISQTYNLLHEYHKDTGLLTCCCGAPAEWAGEAALLEQTQEHIKAVWHQLGKPVIVAACPTCQNHLEQLLPAAGCVSLYTMLRSEGCKPPKSDVGGVTVFDPCAARHRYELQDDIRNFAEEAGLVLHPIANERELARCCSWGGHGSIANPEFVDQVVQTCIKQSEYPFLTYCTNCRDIFAGAGKEALHILDVLLGINRAGRRAPLLHERWNNREEAARTMSTAIRCEGRLKAAAPALELFVNEELLKKLSEQYLTLEAVQEVIDHCEKTKKKLVDADAGTCIGHKRVGHATVWVEYREADGRFELINAYSHRMQMEEG